MTKFLVVFPQRFAAEFLLYNLGKAHIVDFFVKL